MNIALASDNNYAKYLHIVITSILINNKNSEIRFYIIDNGIDDNNKKLITKQVECYSQEIIFMKASCLVGELFVDNTMPLASYSRLFLTRIKDVDKIIYFDCDSLINGSLEELWNTDLTSHYFAGVLDFVQPYYRTLIGLPLDFPYINAGMLVMNLEKMRKENWENKVLDMIKRYKGSIPHHDQGIVNALGNGKIKIISPKYNVIPDYLDYPIDHIMQKKRIFNSYYSKKEILEARTFPVFIHFAPGYYGRPWDVKCTNPFKDLYLSMIGKAGYELEDVLIDKPENKNMVIVRKIYKQYPTWFYSLFLKLLNLYKLIKWKYKLRNIGD